MTRSHSCTDTNLFLSSGFTEIFFLGVLFGKLYERMSCKDATVVHSDSVKQACITVVHYDSEKQALELLFICPGWFLDSESRVRRGCFRCVSKPNLS